MCYFGISQIIYMPLEVARIKLTYHLFFEVTVRAGELCGGRIVRRCRSRGAELLTRRSRPRDGVAVRAGLAAQLPRLRLGLQRARYHHSPAQACLQHRGREFIVLFFNVWCLKPSLYCNTRAFTIVLA